MNKSKEPVDTNLWNTKKVASYLSVPEKTIRDWVFKRQIPVKRVKRLVRFSPAEINQWVENGGASHGD